MEFLPEEFDPWAENYDQDVAAEAGFPFSGYADLLKSILEAAQPQPKEKILDLGCGTGNLTGAFLPFGCQVWGTDFAPRMIAIASLKFPTIPFQVSEVRDPLPASFPNTYDVIVSAYVFHHFPIEEKIRQLLRFKHQHLRPGGRILIGDLMFPSASVMQQIASQYADTWDEEYYWILDRDIAMMEKAGLSVQTRQISFCAGMLWFAL
jgi:putative AdoMet-dependent methyltransferase